MAVIVHSKHAAGILATPRPQSSGAVHAVRFRHTFSVALAAATILELGVLPEYADIVGYTLVPEGDFAGVTFSAGVMTGELGADDNARVQGVELFSAASALTATLFGGKAAAFNVASIPQARGIGLTFSGQVVADASKKLTLILFYKQ